MKRRAAELVPREAPATDATDGGDREERRERRRRKRARLDAYEPGLVLVRVMRPGELRGAAISTRRILRTAGNVAAGVVGSGLLVALAWWGWKKWKAWRDGKDASGDTSTSDDATDATDADAEISPTTSSASEVPEA